MSLLYSLPAVASDSTLTQAASWATIAGLIASIVAIGLAWSAFKKQNEALELQQVLGAWSLLAQKGTGDLGRKYALEFLHSKGKSLNGVDLTGAYFFGLELSGADLCGAHFEGAKLINAHFEGADLREAHFEGANLLGAYFEGANLSYTHFEGASLLSADFEGANLTHTHFEGAKDICPAYFKDCYVSQYSKNHPTAPEGYEFIFETNEDGTPRTKIVRGLRHYSYIELIQLETKNP